MTRLESFLKRNTLLPAHVARESAISRKHLFQVRKGYSDPTRGVMKDITRACSRLLRRKVEARELFDVDGDTQ